MAVRKDKLDKEVMKRLLHYCFGNLTEFYERNQGYLKMSRSTLYKAMEGDYINEEYVIRITELLDSLVTKERFDSVIKLKELLKRIDTFNTSLKMDDWQRVVAYAKDC